MQPDFFSPVFNKEQIDNTYMEFLKQKYGVFDARFECGNPGCEPKPIPDDVIIYDGGDVEGYEE